MYETLESLYGELEYIREVFPNLSTEEKYEMAIRYHQILEEIRELENISSRWG